jgi:predicted metal-dependent peptidase
MSNLSAEDRITKAHIALMQDKRTLAYSGLLMVGSTEVSNTCPTASTNGRDVTYGRAFVESLTDGELRFLVLHETKHKLYQHLFVWRKLYEEDAQLANQACDYVINLEIKDLNKWGDFLVMPEGGLCDEEYRGLDSGEVFARLKEDKENGKDGKGEPMDGHEWEEAKALGELEKDQLAKDISAAVRTGALLAGKQGGEVDRSFDAMMQSKVDWAEQLREFVSSVCVGKGDSTWAKPNRRWLQHNMYLPSQISESIGSICVAIDTSGSISGEDITKALSELVSICDNNQPEKVNLLYWDSHVASHELYHVDTYGSLLTSTRPMGGGGTDVNCVFEYIEKNKLEPVVCIVITDGYTPFPSNTPPYPVLWVMVDNKHTQPPFGTTIRIT